MCVRACTSMCVCMCATQQWEVAREFDSRYTNPQWVRDTKYWPPRAVDALTRFLALQR